jgi:AcrR family transcriptional regulator
MRIKDTQKQQAVIDATIKVINENGFNTASISKIAKEAGVSQATIYIYYQNKEDLVVSVYYEVKEKLTSYYQKDLDDTCSIEENLRRAWHNSLMANSLMPELFSYDQQITYSPFYNLIDSKRMDEFAKPLNAILQKGIKENVLKDLPFGLFIAFFGAPAVHISTRRMLPDFDLNQENIEETFQIAFSAVKK